MEIPSQTECPSCHGSGIAPGTPNQVCNTCQGSGSIAVRNLPPDTEPFSKR